MQQISQTLNHGSQPISNMANCMSCFYDKPHKILVEASILDAFHSLKEYLESERGFAFHMESSERLWVDECERLKN